MPALRTSQANARTPTERKGPASGSGGICRCNPNMWIVALIAAMSAHLPLYSRSALSSLRLARPACGLHAVCCPRLLYPGPSGGPTQGLASERFQPLPQNYFDI
jgi:hypothetical protein